MLATIFQKSFEPYEEVLAYQKKFSTRMRGIGATATFVGSMRDFNENETVLSMYLEYYPQMTQRHLETILGTAMRRWELEDCFIGHRVGNIFPGEAIVVVASWSSHRAHAFESCRFIMEDLKSNTPFWKKEQTEKGARWVEKNTPGTTMEIDREETDIQSRVPKQREENS